MDYSHRAGIDLHIHSTASDGTSTPSQILALARKQGVRAISITDHDTVEGARNALQQGIPTEIQFLSGIEISAIPPMGFNCPGSFHILGYGIDLDNPLLNQTLEKLQNARKKRNPHIIERLKSLGMDITLENVRQIAGTGQIGRPHIAQTMVQKRYAESIDDAFDRFLGKDKAAYVDKFRLDSTQAIELILNAGGTPVLAHPVLLETKTDRILEELIVTLKQDGLEGLEVYYPDHSTEQFALYRQLAERQGLIITGGTDYHGDLKPELQMGSGNGSFYVPYSVYETLIRFRAAK